MRNDPVAGSLVDEGRGEKALTRPPGVREAVGRDDGTVTGERDQARGGRRAFGP
ncbi:MAG: hypothetical protein LBG60_15070 [Bifidobacteriaceae bacterium]|nr:hypothetical protein [Bifidobacteriaceae bacterium]